MAVADPLPFLKVVHLNAIDEAQVFYKAVLAQTVLVLCLCRLLLVRCFVFFA